MIDPLDQARLALRALQKADQIAPAPLPLTAAGEMARSALLRRYLIEAEDALGLMLGLDCTGEDQGARTYSHNSGTCPIHEWLDESDCEEAENRLASMTR